MRPFTSCSVLLGLLALSACGKSSTTPSPSPAQLNLTGTWSGVVGQSQSGSALRLTWTASQTPTGQVASGPAVLVKPAANVPANGVMTGVLNGSQLTLTYVAAAGSVSGFASCAITGAGIGTAAASSITGSFTLTFASCPAATGLEAPDSTQLTLTKQ